MSKKVILTPSEVWKFFDDNGFKFTSKVFEIAENKEFGVVIYLSAEGINPSFIVTQDDITVCEEVAISPIDCERTVEEIYDEYLTSKVIDVIDGGKASPLPLPAVASDEEDDDHELEIEAREADLDEALYGFLSAVVDDSRELDYLEPDIIEDIKDHFLEYLAREHGFAIYRPMYLEDDEGGWFEEYPYDHMDFGDE